MIWQEYELQVYKVTKFEPGKGKTGKGALHFFNVDPKGRTCGQYQAVDVEDIIEVNPGPVIGKRKK